MGQQFGRLDVLVNNAGVSLDEDHDLTDVEIDVIERTLQMNFYGPLHLTRASLPLMKENNYGRIVNVSSSGGSLSAMGSLSGRMPANHISKAALNAQTRLIASALKGYNIKVNAMCPGWVRTRMGGGSARRGPTEGVEAILWLATLPASGPSGFFFKDRKKHPW